MSDEDDNDYTWVEPEDDDEEPLDRLKVGKVYRVNDYALSKACTFGAQNKMITNDHGFIWVCENRVFAHDRKLQACRSLATGEVHPWGYEEMEEVQ